MNVMTWIVILFFVVFILIGYKRGLFRSVFKMVLTGLSFLLAYFLTPFVGSILADNTGIGDYFSEKIYTKIESTVSSRVSDEVESTLGYADEFLTEQLTDAVMSTEPSRNQQVEFIYETELPDFVKDALMANNNDEVRSELGVNGFYEYVANYIAGMIINAISFLLISVLLWLVFTLILLVMSLAVRLPIVSSIDKIGGLLFGALEALLLVWAFFVFVSIFVNTEIGADLYRQIEANKFLSVLYEKNLFISVITGLTVGGII